MCPTLVEGVDIAMTALCSSDRSSFSFCLFAGKSGRAFGLTSLGRLFRSLSFPSPIDRLILRLNFDQLASSFSFFFSFFSTFGGSAKPTTGLVSSAPVCCCLLSGVMGDVPTASSGLDSSPLTFSTTTMSSILPLAMISKLRRLDPSSIGCSAS